MRERLSHLFSNIFLLITAGILAITPAFSATARITKTVDVNRVKPVGGAHPMAQAQFDQGAVEDTFGLDHVQIYFKPSQAQQADLDQLLTDQQNPSSANYHKWLTPEQFGDRFGLAVADQAKVVSWLKSQGLSLQDSSRGRNWIAFAGTAGQISKALHTPLHRYQVEGKMHFANAAAPQVPEALAEVVAGFRGLDDFHPVPSLVPFRKIDPAYSAASGNHYLAPGDWATIYDVKPLYAAGLDGTGVNLAIVGESGISLTDLRTFKTRFGLPANDPKLILYGTDPGVTGGGAQDEATLDLEWSSAIAPKATIDYVYGQDAFTALAYAISVNVAQLVSVSFSSCEPYGVDTLRALVQQANAQGITVFNSSGDWGYAACDANYGAASHGPEAAVMAVFPEVTAVGGTQFAENGGSYWNATNDSTGTTAKSYIPEQAWNETAAFGTLATTGGGPSATIAKPAWQVAPGVPNDGVRDYPDISASAAAGHDGYLIQLGGALGVVGGTSASSPSVAGVFALLNQYEVKQGIQAKPGLGNINPQLYRLATTAPTSFHDITAGDNIVPCVQGSLGCLTGSFGYKAGIGYDLTTGLGTLDANVLVSNWNTVTSPVTVTLTTNATRYTINDSVLLAVAVTSASGTGVPTGTVSIVSGETTLASGPIPAGQQAVAFNFPASMLGGTGSATIAAYYSGDATFSAGGATQRISVVLPAVGTASALVVTASNPVIAIPFDAGAQQGPAWTVNVEIDEYRGVPANLTNFTIDGVQQPVSQYFPSPNIPAGGTVTASVLLRNVSAPVTKQFGFQFLDAMGNVWYRVLPITFRPQPAAGFTGFYMTASPQVMQQNPGNTACPWSQQISIDEIFGVPLTISFLAHGDNDFSSQIPNIFGTTRLAPWGSLQGTVCWPGSTTPGTDDFFVIATDPNGATVQEDLIVTFAAAAAAPGVLATTPTQLSIKGNSTATLNVSVANGQAWTMSVSPSNRTTSWLTLSQSQGTGPAQITLKTNGTGFESGSYRALLTIQAAGTQQQSLTVPVMFVNQNVLSAAFPAPAGGLISAAPPAITGVGNSLSGVAVLSPGAMVSIYGSGLAAAPVSAGALPLPMSLGGVTVAVNGIAAPIYYVSPTQINIQVPFEVGAGPAVIGINNSGSVAGFLTTSAPTSPAILTDGSGNVLSGFTKVKAGGQGSLYVTGFGDTSGLTTGFASALTGLFAPQLLLPVSVNIGGQLGFIEFAGITPGVVGLAQSNFVVPLGTASGTQPVTVTIGGVTSPPANITVQ